MQRVGPRVDGHLLIGHEGHRPHHVGQRRPRSQPDLRGLRGLRGPHGPVRRCQPACGHRGGGRPRDRSLLVAGLGHLDHIGALVLGRPPPRLTALCGSPLWLNLPSKLAATCSAATSRPGHQPARQPRHPDPAGGPRGRTQGPHRPARRPPAPHPAQRQPRTAPRPQDRTPRPGRPETTPGPRHPYSRPLVDRPTRPARELTSHVSGFGSWVLGWVF